MGDNIIELNGKRYDAVTGAYLGKSSVIPPHILHSGGKVIDGFVRPSRPGSKPHAVKASPAGSAPKAPAKVAATPTPKPPASHTAAAVSAATPAPRKIIHATALAHHTSTAKTVTAHQPEHAKTLMRRSVHRPDVKMKPAIKPHAPAEVMAKPQSAMMRKRSAYEIDPRRKEHALAIGKHQAISHFVPFNKMTEHTRPSPGRVPVIAVKSAPAKTQHTVAHIQNHPAHQHTDMFEAALAKATSHQQPAHKPRTKRVARNKLINAVSIAAAFLIIGGFIGYLNLPRIELRVASFQAGFSAAMPGYSPTGYALNGGIKHAGNTVSLNFRSGEDQYTITQQASNWNSQTLLDSTYALNNGTHDTVQKDGQIIYIYDHGTSASWVNGGVRYDLSGNVQLSRSEIASIATSL